MREPYWSDGTAALYVGDAREMLAEMPGRSVDCVVTSPPYWELRDYGMPDQFGQEPTAEAYVGNLVAVFTELRRVLHPS